MSNENEGEAIFALIGGQQGGGIVATSNLSQAQTHAREGVSNGPASGLHQMNINALGQEDRHMIAKLSVYTLKVIMSHVYVKRNEFASIL